MIPAILIIFAALCKAVADTLQWHFDSSVFRKLNPYFWNPWQSATRVHFMRFTRYRPDAWHFANSGMICCFISAAALDKLNLHWCWQVIAGGVLFNVAFEIFFSKVLRKK